MNDRTKFIGAWVSKQEKEEVVKLAKGTNMSVSDLIRHRVIRPMTTLPEAIQNIKLHIDGKFKKIENIITEQLKEELFYREPIRRTYIEEYAPIKKLHRPQKTIEPSGHLLEMKKVLAEMEKLVKNGELILETVPEEEIERARPKTDQIAFIEWKTKKTHL